MFMLLTDDDVRDALSAVDAVALMRSALVEHHRAALHAPARLHAGLGPGGLVFTAGRRPGKAYGFRVYGNFPTAAPDTRRAPIPAAAPVTAARR